MNKFQKEKEAQFDWVFDKEDNPVHISQAKSGRNGYFCMGCKAEMQAMISKTENRLSFFRHDPGELEKRKSCTYGTETYRHKLGKEILQRIKKIQVPVLYKYPPKGFDGKKIKLREAGLLHAHRVEIELTFFLTESGELKHGRGSEIPSDERMHIVRPDVTFFNSKDEPVLFIELVVTHKVSYEKKARLKSIGIDTIQVKLPPKNAPELELSFLKTEYTKWIYNGIESRTDYFQLPKGNGERISEFDELQRDLFEENFKCRSAQIGKLIRSITRCLESEYYRRIEVNIRSRTSEIESAQRGLESKLDSIRKEIETKVQREFKPEEERIEQEEKEFRKYEEGLGKRYLKKRREIEEQENSIIDEQIRLGEEEEDLEDEEIQFKLRTDISSKENGQATKNLWNDIRRGRRVIHSERANIIELRESEDRFRTEIQIRSTREAERIRVEERSFEKRTREWTKSDEITTQRSIEHIRSEIQRFGDITSRKEDELEEKLRREFERSLASIRNGDIKTTGQLPSGIKGDLSAAGVIADFTDAQKQLERIRAAKDYFEQKTWKNWHPGRQIF